MSTLAIIATTVVSIAAILGGFSVIWSKALKPAARLITTTEQMLPLLVTLTAVFRESPEAFKVLNEIAAQFHTDSGTTLRDVINRLEAAAIESKASADILRIGAEATRQLLERLTVKVEDSAATSLRNELAATGVADDLARAHKRADEHVGDEPGAAADASARQTDKEKQGK